MFVATLLLILIGGGCTSDTTTGSGTAAELAPASAACFPEEGQSVARAWNEATLGAIRRDFPAPVVHARNLFHVSAAMWDAWAGYDETAKGYFVDEARSADDIATARAEAMSYAAYGVLTHRYRDATGGATSLAEFDDLMRSLCLDPALAETSGDDPAAFGNRIATAIIQFGSGDGSNEADGYHDRTYTPINEPLVVAEPGTIMADPNRWQPLQIEGMSTQNDVPVGTNVQEFIGSQWGGVTAFALPAGPELPIDPGPPPLLGDPVSDAAFKTGALEVIRGSSQLDPDDGTRIDIGPGALGNNPVGTDGGNGYELNPITGRAYEANEAARGDFTRVIAEYWADGPRSETPPGHWNTIANLVSDDPESEHTIAGQGEPVDRLEWDVKLYFALNGATHDAAVAAWGLKYHYDYARPISMIRYMGGLGQSSDPNGPSFHPDGLPLEPSLVEVVTAESSAPGERHASLADHLGEIAIRAWAGDRSTPDGGVRWIRAVEWAPFQKETFVTPAFAGYVSGHSVFSRAAAEVLAAFTGSPFFPGGVGEWTVPVGALEFEEGPSEAVTLQWASYFDAADQAGRSRIYGGIHVPADDLRGREVGAECGRAGWDLAQRYFSGEGVPLTES